MKKRTVSHQPVDIYTDGGSQGNPGPSAIGVVIVGDNDKELLAKAKVIRDGTNNVAEYRALIYALKKARKLTRGSVMCWSDSRLMVNQVTGVFQIRDPKLKRLAKKAHKLARAFDEVGLMHVPRSHPRIQQADRMLNIARNSARWNRIRNSSSCEEFSQHDRLIYPLHAKQSRRL